MRARVTGGLAECLGEEGRHRRGTGERRRERDRDHLALRDGHVCADLVFAAGREVGVEGVSEGEGEGEGEGEDEGEGEGEGQSGCEG